MSNQNQKRWGDDVDDDDDSVDDSGTQALWMKTPAVVLVPHRNPAAA